MNIHAAVAGLPPSVQRHIVEQFELCETPDVYGGDLDKYLLVIAQKAEQTRQTLTGTVEVLERLGACIRSAKLREPVLVVETFQIKARRVFHLPANIENARHLPPGEY